jgi:hypothetical protein
VLQVLFGLLGFRPGQSILPQSRQGSLQLATLFLPGQVRIPHLLQVRPSLGLSDFGFFFGCVGTEREMSVITRSRDNCSAVDTTNSGVCIAWEFMSEIWDVEAIGGVGMDMDGPGGATCAI